MDMINSTITPIASSSLPAGTNATSSTVFSTPTTSSLTPSTTLTDSLSSVVQTIISLVPAIYNSRTTTLTTSVPIVDPSPSYYSSSQPLSTEYSLTQTITPTFTENVPDSVSSSSSSSSSSSVLGTSKSHHKTSAAVFVVVALTLVITSFIAGFFLLLYRRRRRRRRRQKVKPTFKRPESCLLFVDSDPFGCVAQSPATMMRSVGDENQRKMTRSVVDVPSTSNRWESVGNGYLVSKAHSRMHRSLNAESGATLLSRPSDNGRSSPTYPGILLEQHELLEPDATAHNLEEPSTPIPLVYSLPPPRPSRSPLRMSNRSTSSSLGSFSTTNSMSPLNRLPPEKESPYEETFPLNVQKKATLL